MPKIQRAKYNAAMYLRLSRDDGDKTESDSIANQRALIRDYVSKLNDVEIVCEMIDDGYSGSNFDRPGFTELLKAIKEKKVNCVIVKDLSRFSRDYIGSGMYVMNLFPKWGIRVIAINDNYDSINPLTANDELILSFKSIINDVYLRDISTKIRSHLEIKRKNGEYIGAFAAYGFLKSPDDRHKLIIDEAVSEVVVRIYSLKMDGLSPNAIANKLNDSNIPCPSEYKKSIGSKHCGFASKGEKAQWTGQAVQRILKNPIYMGTLIQGKKTTISHKIKKTVEKAKDDWVVTEAFVPAIISREVFEVVQNMLGRDTRNSSRQTDSNIFSGLLYCADCKDTMVRQISKYKNTSYAFYRCSTQKNIGGCFNHNIREDSVYEIVLTAINAHTQAVIGLEKAVKILDKADLNRNNRSKIERLIKEKKAEISKRKKDIFFTHQSFADGIITEEEFKEFKAIYDMQIDEAKKSIERLRHEQDNLTDDVSKMCAWTKDFKKFGKVSQLNHKMLTLLVDKIYIGGDKSVNICFRYKNEFESLSKLVETINSRDKLMARVG